MMNITFELAQLLKDMGYCEPTNMYFTKKGKLTNCVYRSNHNANKGACVQFSCPDVYEVNAWLMAVHTICVSVQPAGRGWSAHVWRYGFISCCVAFLEGYNTFYAAQIAGITKALNCIKE